MFCLKVRVQILPISVWDLLNEELIFGDKKAVDSLETLAFFQWDLNCPHLMADRVGFEPTDGCPSPDFESGPL